MPPTPAGEARGAFSGHSFDLSFSHPFSMMHFARHFDPDENFLTLLQMACKIQLKKKNPFSTNSVSRLSSQRHQMHLFSTNHFHPDLHEQGERQHGGSPRRSCPRGQHPTKRSPRRQPYTRTSSVGIYFREGKMH